MSDILIKRGDKSELVSELQGYLAQLGFACTVDGDFGPKTERAVIDFQKTHKLTPDGIVGPLTIGVLEEALKVVPVAEQLGHPTAPRTTDRFDEHGWDREARRWDIHPGRIGKAIDPIGATVHTTDMMPNTFAGLCKAWRKQRGAGNAATYLLGREPWDGTPEEYPTCGLVQFAPITRNSNHAGGFQDHHGWLVKGKQRVAHPNSVYVGIEVHAGGKLRKGKDKWIQVDAGKVVEPEDVFVAPDGTGWHRVTDYQLDTLGKLLDALNAYCRPVPDGWTIAPNGDYKRCGSPWAPLGIVRFTSHVELDPINKTDPGPQVTAWLRERYGRATV